jgi:hypothetical protein
VIEGSSLTPQQRIALYQKTRLGLIFFIVSFSLSFFAVLISLVPCIGGLIGIVSFGSLIAGFVLMLIGSKVFPSSHRMLVIVSLVGLVILFIISIMVSVIGVFAVGIGSFMPGKDMTGQDIIGSLNAMRTLALVTMIPSMLTMAVYSLPFFKVSRTWGKGVLAAFIITIPIAFGISFVMRDAAIDDAIAEINPVEKFEAEDFSEEMNDLTIGMFPATVVAELPILLLIIAVVGSLLYVNALRSEAQLSLPPMERTIENIFTPVQEPVLVDPAPIEAEVLEDAPPVDQTENN